MSNRSWRYVLLVVGFVALLSACAPQGDTMTDTVADLENTSWRLAYYGTSGDTTDVIEGTEVTLQFEGDGQAGGNGGCNSYGTTYEVSNGALSFGEIVTTLMACSGEGIMEQEDAYLAALRSAEAFEVTADQLEILYDGGDRVLTFERMEADGGRGGATRRHPAASV